MQEENPWKTLKSEVKYENAWIKVTEFDVVNPSGNNGIYGVVHMKGLAVGVLPLDEDLNTYLVGQYRYTLSEYSWEIPEGGSHEDEDPKATALRELEEETGLIAQRIIPVGEFNTSNSVTDERAFAYVALGLSKGQIAPDDTEDLKIWKLPFSTVYEMAIEGKIKDGLSLFTIFKTQHFLEKGLLKF